MEDRQLPRWTLRPVDKQQLIPCEMVIKRLGEEVYGVKVQVLGLPWIGRFHERINLELLLEEPSMIYQVIQLAFLSDNPSDGVVIMVDEDKASELEVAKSSVLPKLSTNVPKEKIFWICLKPDYKAMLGSENPNLKQANEIKLPDANQALKALCESIESLFQ